MPPIDFTALWNTILGPLGALGMALLAVVGFARGWWVPGYIHKADQKRIERLADVTERLTDAVSASTSTITTAVDRLTDEVRDARRR